MYIYAHTLKMGESQIHMHYATRAVAEWYALQKSNVARSCVTRVKVPGTWKTALIELANNPGWLNDLPHEEVK